MINQLDTENGDYNLTSQVTILTDTPNATYPVKCQAYIEFGDGTKNLDASGGDFELEIVVGSQVIQPAPQTITFGTDARAGVWTVEFAVPANTAVVIKAKSPNAGDTDVDVTATLYETSVTDNIAMNGDKQSTTDLKDFADAGYDPATNKVQGVVLVDTTTTNTDMRGTNSAALATVCTEARLAELDAANIPTDLANISSAITALNDLSEADIQTIFGIDASSLMEELTGDPGATPKIGPGLMLLFMALRNKHTSSETAEDIYNNAGTSILQAALSDASNVFTKGKFA